MEEYGAVRAAVVAAVKEEVQGEPEEVAKAAERIADAAMDAIAENYRSITEVHSIVEAVRAGHKVQIAYADPDEDDFMDPYTVRACW